MKNCTRKGHAGFVSAEAQQLRWVLVDARWLEPPEPMEQVLAAIDYLRPGQSIRFLIHREPLPLYGALKHLGYRHKTHMLEDGCYEVQIEPLIQE